MYNVGIEVQYRFIDYNNGFVSSWFPSQRSMLKNMVGYCRCSMRADLVLEHLKFHKDESVEVSDLGYRHIAIYDNFGRFYVVNMLDGVFWDDHWLWYRFVNPELYVPDIRRGFYRTYYNFRKQPVPHTSSRRRGGYYRSISYRNTKLLSSDLESKENNIRAYRPRRVVDAWDIEPVRHLERSWKSQRKCHKQWERGIPNEKPMRKYIPVEDIWEGYDAEGGCEEGQYLGCVG